jgi:hypothetical protein
MIPGTEICGLGISDYAHGVQSQAVSWDLRSLIHLYWQYLLLGIVGLIALVVFLRRKS